MKKVFTFIALIFPIVCFSQTIEIIDNGQLTNMDVYGEFEFLFLPDTANITSVATIRASGKHNISELFFSIKKEANIRGANSFRLMEYINDDVTGKKSSLTLHVYYTGKNLLTENDKYKEGNIIYIFGKDKAGKGRTSFKLNGIRTEVKYRHYLKYKTTLYNEVKLSKGGIFGKELSFIGDENQPGLFLTLSGLGVVPKAAYNVYSDSNTAYAGGGFGIAFNTGNIKVMDSNLGRLLTHIWKEDILPISISY